MANADFDDTVTKNHALEIIRRLSGCNHTLLCAKNKNQNRHKMTDCFCETVTKMSHEDVSILLESAGPGGKKPLDGRAVWKDASKVATWPWGGKGCEGNWGRGSCGEKGVCVCKEMHSIFFPEN